MEKCVEEETEFHSKEEFILEEKMKSILIKTGFQGSFEKIGKSVFKLGN